jgi:hypothetical protein
VTPIATHIFDRKEPICGIKGAICGKQENRTVFRFPAVILPAHYARKG